jgi:DNA-binding LacI/PurR family transcriptional regulator/DNA-binding transcriptional regulator YhcF (GntR family)
MTNTEIVFRQEYPRSRAIRQLRDLIRDRYRTGDWLPTELELCAKLSVSRGTLRSAMKLLEAEGLLRAQAGRGRIVTSSADRSTPAKTVMRDAIAVVTHEPTGGPRSTGSDTFIQMNAIESIGRAGLHALMVRPDRPAAELLRGLAAERPYGVVLLRRVIESEPGREVLEELRAAGASVVMYGDLPELADFDSVVADHETGSYLLTKWLLSQGRSRILRFWQLDADSPGSRTHEWLAKRDAGFERALREANIEPMPAIVHRDFIARDETEENFNACAHLCAGQLMPYLSKPGTIDAIMVVSDGRLTPVAAACRLFGITPNREVLFAGYDNYWPDDPCRRFEPTIPAATIDKQNSRIGEQLIELLLARAGRRLGAAAEHRVVPPKLLVPEGAIS